MTNYNFLNLSPPEFEALSRDVLQQHLRITLESFTTGRDKGIDFRYSATDKNKLIVQCKRYNNFPALLNNLKKEHPKVAKLNPKRYIITTSVGLTPDQKDIIKALFNPFVKATADIFGKDDLNNLLGLHPTIEKQHFKLWLSSTTVLEGILHKRIHNQSQFEKDKVAETIRLYVENESYEKAVDTIKQHNYVIISGIPGIGKTTLARMLVYQILATGFQEFVFMSDSISEGYEVFNDDISQVFLFDDFLGRNFLDNKLKNNEEQRIVKFIEKVKKSKNKVLILTTREYILTQAKARYDVFENKSLEFAKCVIDLSHYTKWVRAKILYNHIFFSNLKPEYVEAILKKKSYNTIISHDNYNPRIIQTVLQEDVWSTIDPNDFMKKFRSFLDYPDSIWQHVYENQISKFSQCLLANLMSTGSPILLEDLKALVRNFAARFAGKYGIIYSEIEFMKSLRELENTFITTNKDFHDKIVVNYQNPSVQDFLVHYFRNFPDFLSDIIESALYFNQLFTVFSLDVNATNKIPYSETLREKLWRKITHDFDSLSSSVLVQAHYLKTGSYRWERENYSTYRKLIEIKNKRLFGKVKEAKAFVKERFLSNVIPDDLSGEDLIHYTNLLLEFKNELDFDRLELLNKYFNNFDSLEHMEGLAKFESIYPKEFKIFTGGESFRSRLSDIMYNEASEVNESYLEDTQDEIQRWTEKFSIDSSLAIFHIEERIEQKERREEQAQDWGDYDRDDGPNPVDFDSGIEDMFDGLSTEADRD